jgi:hypothetical protein
MVEQEIQLRVGQVPAIVPTIQLNIAGLQVGQWAFGRAAVPD